MIVREAMRILAVTLPFVVGAGAIAVAHLYLWPNGNYALGLGTDIMGVTFTAMGVSATRRLQ